MVPTYIKFKISEAGLVFFLSIDKFVPTLFIKPFSLDIMISSSINLLIFTLIPSSVYAYGFIDIQRVMSFLGFSFNRLSNISYRFSLVKISFFFPPSIF